MRTAYAAPLTRTFGKTRQLGTVCLKFKAIKNRHFWRFFALNADETVRAILSNVSQRLLPLLLLFHCYAIALQIRVLILLYF